jgi:hypothetical protein
MSEAVTIEPTQMHRPSDNITVPMDTEITKMSPMDELARLKDQIRSARNLDVGFDSGKDFDVEKAIDLICECDKYTQTSIFASWRGTLNMAIIREAMKLVPANGFEKTAEGRDEYDNMLRKAMEEYEQDGDFAPRALPSMLALNDRLRCVMIDQMIDVRPIESTLEFMAQDAPKPSDFEAEYEDLLNHGERPAMTKREFCEIKARGAERNHDRMTEHGTDALQLCEDLKITYERGYGDLPENIRERLFEKFISKMIDRRNNLNIREMNRLLKPGDRLEAEASRALVEFVFEQVVGRGMVSEY